MPLAVRPALSASSSCVSPAASLRRQIGMVNKVVPLEELVPATMEMAHRIAQQDAFALRMAKRGVNLTLDVQGYSNALEAAFDMHHYGHTRARVVNDGYPS